MLKKFSQSCFAGLLIGLGGFAYLSNPVIGQFLFAFGLVCVVLYQLPLYTGTVGFIDFKSKSWCDDLFIILLGNGFGTIIAALIAQGGQDVVIASATEIVHRRISTGYLKCFGLAIGCGVVMSAAVEAARTGNAFTRWMPLLLGIPLFISCGMVHSIADLFYFFTSDVFDLTNSSKFIVCWILAVLGNAVGCNLYRIFSANKITS